MGATEQSPGRPLDGWDWAAILSVAGFVLSTAGHFIPANTQDERSSREAATTAGQMLSGVASMVSLLAAPPLCPDCKSRGRTSRMRTDATASVSCPICGYAPPVVQIAQ